jgi:serine protease
MSPNRYLGALLGAITAASLPSVALAQTSAPTTEIVIDFDDDASAAEVAEVTRALGVSAVANSDYVTEDRIYRAAVPSERVGEVLERLNADAHVQAADTNTEMRAFFTPNDPLLPQQWGMRRVGAVNAWDSTCGLGVTVAVVDTGVACENYGEFTRIPDLAGTRCVAGWNFVKNNAHANDDQGHGTHVAGTIAQTTHNGIGAAGVAYCATIMPVKVLDAQGRGTLANVAEGIRWAADHGAQVINLSLGGGGRSKVMAEAVAYARRHGTTVVCAAGNNGRYVESPANEPGAVAVSAIDSGDQIAFFSSRGPEVDLAAPGVGILQQTICDHGRNRCEQFASWSGTSMAAPHVAGVAALLYSLGVNDPDAVEAILKSHASRPAHGGSQAELYGAGIVSAENITQGVPVERGVGRLGTLVFLSIALAWWIKSKKGELSWGWILPAYFTAVGLFFLPRFVPHMTPGVDLLMRPLVDWDGILLGANWHRWLAFANAGVVMAFVGLGFGSKSLRSPIGGVALGVSAYLLTEAWMRTAFAPLGSFLFVGWTVLNALIALWVARIGIDRKTAE